MYGYDDDFDLQHLALVLQHEADAGEGQQEEDGRDDAGHYRPRQRQGCQFLKQSSGDGSDDQK